MQIPKSDVVQVRILYTEACPHTPPTAQRIQEIARENRIPIKMEMVLVRTQEEAGKYRLIGSPTVLVNGVDIDPLMRDKTTFGFT